MDTLKHFSSLHFFHLISTDLLTVQTPTFSFPAKGEAQQPTVLKGPLAVKLCNVFTWTQLPQLLRDFHFRCFESYFFTRVGSEKQEISESETLNISIHPGEKFGFCQFSVTFKFYRNFALQDIQHRILFPYHNLVHESTVELTCLLFFFHFEPRLLAHEVID